MNVDSASFYKIYNSQKDSNSGLNADNGDEIWKKAADAELDKRDEDLGFQKGAQRGASGWNGDEDNYIELDELPKSELRRIEDINTTEESIKQLERIVHHRLHGPRSESSISMIDKHTIRNFEKMIPRDDKELKKLKAKIRIRKESRDKAKQRRINRKESTTIKSRSGSVMKVICRSVNNLNRQRRGKSRGSSQKRKSQSKKYSGTDDNQVDEEYGTEDALYEDSECVLTAQSADHPSSTDIAVAVPLAKLLKPHQIDGIKFMWKNSFGDLQSQISAASPIRNVKAAARGCILAHNMGLGKTLQGKKIDHV